MPYCKTPFHLRFSANDRADPLMLTILIRIAAVRAGTYYKNRANQ
ncbi:hypothetical protein [Shimazuella soli]|nr:hypothetical protein [Shimazuella soli]